MYELNSRGYDLKETIDGWEFISRGEETVSGDLTRVVAIMVLKFGFWIEEIEESVAMMVRDNCNAIHFGMYKTMIFTYRQEDKAA